MVARTLAAGLTVREVPIEFVERVRGDSKMSGAVATESLKRITAWGLRERRAQVRRAGDGPMSRRRRLLQGGRCSSSSSWCRSLEIYVLVQVGQVIGAVVDDRCCWSLDSILGDLADQARGRPRLAGAARGAGERPDAGRPSSPTAR